jgi:hypothetical protein
MSESSNIPTPLYSLPPLSCDLFLPLRRISFSLSFILVIPFAPLHRAVVLALPLYTDFISELEKYVGHFLFTLSPTNIGHAIYLITFYKAENPDM